MFNYIFKVAKLKFRRFRNAIATFASSIKVKFNSFTSSNPKTSGHIYCRSTGISADLKFWYFEYSQTSF